MVWKCSEEFGVTSIGENWFKRVWETPQTLAIIDPVIMLLFVRIQP